MLHLLLAGTIALVGVAPPRAAHVPPSAAHLEADLLVNPGFERAENPGEVPFGWDLAHGAGNPNGRPSRVESAKGEVVEGKRALVLEADASTGNFQFVSQTMDAEPGHRWTLHFAAKSTDVRREGSQFFNAYVRVGFQNADGKLVAQDRSPMITGTRDWGSMSLTAIAPEGTVSCQVACFLSMSGRLELDDFELERSPVQPFGDKAVREAAFDAAANRLRATYPFFALEGYPDPDKLFKRHRSKVIKATEPLEFAQALGKMLDDLDDLHVHLRVGEQRISTGPRSNPNPTNWNMDAVAERFTELVFEGKSNLVARMRAGAAGTPGTLGYVRLGSFSVSKDELVATDAAMDELADVTGWVIDVRPNGGGGEDQAEFIAARFVDEKIEYARSRYRDAFAPGDIEAFTEDYPRWIDPREDRAGTVDRRPIAVLQGPFCVSSTEGFLLMMRALETATLVGLPSRGASANPGVFQLTPELTLVSSRWQSLTLEGDCIERRGIPPDVEVKERPSKYLKADPTLEAALELLK